MRSFLVAAALVIGAGGASAFAGSFDMVRGGVPFELSAHEDAASFDRGRGKPQDQDFAEPSAREHADEEVTGSLAVPGDDADEMMEIPGKSAALRGEDSGESEGVGKSFQRGEEREAQAPADSEEEFTGSIDRSAGAIDKPQARGKAIGEDDEDAREFGDDAGKPGADYESD